MPTRSDGSASMIELMNASVLAGISVGLMWSEETINGSLTFIIDKTGKSVLEISGDLIEARVKSIKIWRNINKIYS